MHPIAFDAESHRGRRAEARISARDGPEAARFNEAVEDHGGDALLGQRGAVLGEQPRAREQRRHTGVKLGRGRSGARAGNGEADEQRL